MRDEFRGACLYEEEIPGARRGRGVDCDETWWELEVGVCAIASNGNEVNCANCRVEIPENRFLSLNKTIMVSVNE
jgi:hypothetical protein